MLRANLDQFFGRSACLATVSHNWQYSKRYPPYTKTARLDFLAARDAAPNSTDVYVNLASVALAENKLDEAIGFYNSALGIDGANFNSLRLNWDGVSRLARR